MVTLFVLAVVAIMIAKAADVMNKVNYNSK